MDIVLSKGFPSLTMSRLADQLELTPGALYRYFSSKDALIGELEARAISQLHALLDAERAKWRPVLPREVVATQSGLYEVVAVGVFYERLTLRQPRLFRLVSKTLADTEVLVSDHRAASNVAASLGGILRCVAEMFDAARADGCLRPGNAEQRTAIYWSAHHGALQTDKLGRFAPALLASNLGPALRRALLSGWGADETLIGKAEHWAATEGKQR